MIWYCIALLQALKDLLLQNLVFEIIAFFYFLANLCTNKHNVFIASYLMIGVFLTHKQGIKWKIKCYRLYIYIKTKSDKNIFLINIGSYLRSNILPIRPFFPDSVTYFLCLFFDIGLGSLGLSLGSIASLVMCVQQLYFKINVSAISVYTGITEQQALNIQSNPLNLNPVNPKYRK